MFEELKKKWTDSLAFKLAIPLGLIFAALLVVNSLKTEPPKSATEQVLEQLDEAKQTLLDKSQEAISKTLEIGSTALDGYNREPNGELPAPQAP